MTSARVGHVRWWTGIGLSIALAGFTCACTTNLRLDISDNTKAPAGPAPATSPQPSSQFRSDVLPDNSRPPVPAEPMRSSDAAPLPSEGTKSLGWRAEAPEAGKLDGNTVVVVKQGDTLYQISRRYNVPLTDIYRANNLLSPNLKVGQHLIIPAKS